MIYFAGCALNFALPRVGEATRRVLGRMGWEVGPSAVLCAARARDGIDGKALVCDPEQEG